MVLKKILSKNRPLSKEEIEKVKQGLKKLNPSEWDDTKIKLYRQSLHRHHDIELSNENIMKSTGVGMISVLIIAVSIIYVYALPYIKEVSNSSVIDVLIYDILLLSILTSIIAIILFMRVISNVRKPGIMFTLDTPICGIEETDNIGTLESKEFNVTMLRYEIHEYIAQVGINRIKKKIMMVGQLFTLSGIVLLALSLTISFGPIKDSYVAKCVRFLFPSYNPVMNPLTMLVIIIIAAVIVYAVFSNELKYLIKRITRSERCVKKQNHPGEGDADPGEMAETLENRAVECLKKSKKGKEKWF